MTKLIDILRNILTTPKDVVEFELLAEQKISEIEDILDKTDKEKLDYSWIKDWEDAKKAVDQWKAYHKVTNITPGQLEKKSVGGELANISLYVKIRKTNLWNDIPTVHPNSFYEKWKKVGIIPTKGEYDWVKNWEDAKQAIDEWKIQLDDPNIEISASQLQKESIGGNLANPVLYETIRRNPTLWNSIPVLPEYDDEAEGKWATLGIKFGTGFIKKSKYDNIKTVQQAREEIEKIRRKKYPTSEKKLTVEDIRNVDGGIGLYKYILRHIFPQIEERFFHRKWHELNVIGQIDWTQFTEEDFKNLITELNLGKNNYIFVLREMAPRLYEAIKQHITKQDYNGIQRREFWNRIGMQYTPLGERMVYAYEFEDIEETDTNGDKILVSYVYVGLTNDPNRRNRQHLNLDQLNKQINQDENKIEEDLADKATEGVKILKKERNKLSAVTRFLRMHPEINSDQVIQKKLSEFMDAFKAADIEGKMLDEYKNNGWLALNQTETGGLGGGIKTARTSRVSKKRQKQALNTIYNYK
jgi:hypothetical protein